MLVPASNEARLTKYVYFHIFVMQRKACHSFMHTYVNTIILRAGSFVDESGIALLRSSVKSSCCKG